MKVVVDLMNSKWELIRRRLGKTMAGAVLKKGYRIVRKAVIESRFRLINSFLGLRLRLSIRHLHGPTEINCTEDEFIVLSLVKNGEDYIEPFIEHYLSLGAEHIVLLDNGSTDQTIALAQRYEKITILQTPFPFKYEKITRRYLLSRFARNCWALVVDVDEFFDYPFSDILSLSDLISYLNENSYTAVVAHMLDMFSDKPLSSGESGENGEADFRQAHKYYDLSDVQRKDYTYRNVISNHDIKVHVGGIRKMVFGHDALLVKHPLLFYKQGVTLTGTTGSHMVGNARIADFSCVLYHYKFLGGFFERTKEAVEQGNYYKGSVAYKRYYNVLTESPDVKMHQDTSRRLESIQDLIDQKFVVVSDKFALWAHRRKDNALQTQSSVNGCVGKSGQVKETEAG